MIKLPSISDALRDVTAKTEAALISNTQVDFVSIPKKLYFHHGNIKEITNVLKSISESPKQKDKKYPLIALFRDVKEEITQQKEGLATKFNAHLGIFTVSEPNLRTEDRKTKNFDKILVPIFEEFITQLSRSTAFGSPAVSNMGIVKWDCYFYGTNLNNKNEFGDYVDAIDIEKISLTLKPNCT